VLSHASALLKSTPGGVCQYIQADLRDPRKILDEAAKTLDFAQPAAIMILMHRHATPQPRRPASDTGGPLGGGPPPGACCAARATRSSSWPEGARHNGHADLLRERIDGRVGQ
jgi:hypothetical protein